MGACLCCLPHRLDPSHNDSSHRCGSFPFLSCCGMYEALLHPSDESDQRDLSIQRNDSCTGNPAPTDAATTSGSFDGDVCVSDGISAKVSSYLTQTPDGESRTTAHEARCMLIGHSEEKKPLDYRYGLQMLNKSEKDVPSFPVVDEDDACPICLEGYEFENPKLTTRCGHCFHLSCILEWMERSSHCAICYQEMAFDERE